jgi:hypothetical protein
MAGKKISVKKSFVSKITNSKHQISNKSQIPIFNDQNLLWGDIVWVFEFRSLEFVCNLIFGILISQ